jgi:hypothetical protein
MAATTLASFVLLTVRRLSGSSRLCHPFAQSILHRRWRAAKRRHQNDRLFCVTVRARIAPAFFWCDSFDAIGRRATR